MSIGLYVFRCCLEADFISSLILLSRVYAQVNKCLRPAQMETKGFTQLSKQIWELFGPRQIYFEASKLGPNVSVSNHFGR